MAEILNSIIPIYPFHFTRFQFYPTALEDLGYCRRSSGRVGRGRPLPSALTLSHDDVIKWKHFPRYWPFVRGIHRSTVNSPHKGQWRGALMFSLICARINGWVNSSEADDLRRYCVHYDVIVMTRRVFLGSLFKLDDEISCLDTSDEF